MPRAGRWSKCMGLASPPRICVMAINGPRWTVAPGCRRGRMERCLFRATWTGGRITDLRQSPCQPVPLARADISTGLAASILIGCAGSSRLRSGISLEQARYDMRARQRAWRTEGTSPTASGSGPKRNMGRGVASTN